MMACNPQNRLFCVFLDFSRISSKAIHALSTVGEGTSQRNRASRTRSGVARHGRRGTQTPVSDVRFSPLCSPLCSQWRGVTQPGGDADGHRRITTTRATLCGLPRVRPRVRPRIRRRWETAIIPGLWKDAVRAAIESTFPDRSEPFARPTVCGKGGDTDPGRDRPVGQRPGFAHRVRPRIRAAAVIRPTPGTAVRREKDRCRPCDALIAVLMAVSRASTGWSNGAGPTPRTASGSAH